MKFEEFIKIDQVKKTEKDKQLARSLLKTANNDIEFLNSLEITEKSARKITTNYYDILRSILEAIAIMDGYKILSHEAFTYYLIERGEDLLASKFDRFRKIRNGINYYGKNVQIEEAKEYSQEMLKLINILKEKYLKELK